MSLEREDCICVSLVAKVKIPPNKFGHFNSIDKKVARLVLSKSDQAFSPISVLSTQY